MLFDTILFRYALIWHNNIIGTPMFQEFFQQTCLIAMSKAYDN